MASRRKIALLLARLEGTAWLAAALLYGAGLRLMECLRLRIQDVDLDRRVLTVRAGKGVGDRRALLPEKTVEPMRTHFERVQVLWQQEHGPHRRGVSSELAGVYLPHVLEVKYPRAGHVWPWLWVFPAKELLIDPCSGRRRRHHWHEAVLQRAVKKLLSPPVRPKQSA